MKKAPQSFTAGITSDFYPSPVFRSITCVLVPSTSPQTPKIPKQHISPPFPLSKTPPLPANHPLLTGLPLPRFRERRPPGGTRRSRTRPVERVSPSQFFGGPPPRTCPLILAFGAAVVVVVAARVSRRFGGAWWCSPWWAPLRSWSIEPVQVGARRGRWARVGGGRWGVCRIKCERVLSWLVLNESSLKLGYL